MVVLGHFETGLYGKLHQLKVSTDAHVASATGAEHGAVSAATVNMIMRRDASGRVDVVAPPASDNTTKVPTTAWVLTEIGVSGGGTVTSVGSGVGLTGGPITANGTISLANTAVVAGAYTLANITVDAQGRITAASSGTGVTEVTGTAPVVSSGGLTPAISMVAATGSVNGYMSSTFATKLNGIEALAAVNISTTVFGRSGAIVAVANDYNITDIDGVTISDSAPFGGANGDIWFEF